ncbi:hypothetical protein BKP35_18205 [Anaerobacillus arseniciselenatis]|uniref:Uncharacterized protein n=1 Tax=Anaerobacillus arseniciselenatis TaxID=85682 RepID=A0A1S2L5G9_9BACI|nr:hypothetical protein [Anaerobacillus arseniciselenatis]OIJ07621.1 hypothetical protein BKP35_18205 [Anaerobacillus arseniciselenatis]
MLRLKSEEVAALLCHMTIMRKPTKKGLKKKNDRQEAKATMKTYDQILEKIQQIDDEQEIHELELDHAEIEFLQTFIPWYIGELEKEFNEEHNQESEALNSLKVINNMLLVAV